MRKQVTVKVPATAANMGPGFDCLGMALDIWNSVQVTVEETGFEIYGEGADALPGDETNLVYKCLHRAFTETRQDVPRVRVVCRNEIPLDRGLGSSSAAVLAGLVAGNEICGGPLSRAHILEIAAGIEGHPDNVSAALLGGCQIVVREEGQLVTAAVPVPEDLQAVVFVPDVPMPTDRSRSLLPAEVTMKDAVYNIGRVALLVRGLSTNDLTDMAIAMGDQLHQPTRQTIFPAVKNIFRAALGAGAIGVFLAGGGSSVLALACGRELTIGYEMADAAAKSGVDGSLKITRPTVEGAQVVESR